MDLGCLWPTQTKKKTKNETCLVSVAKRQNEGRITGRGKTLGETMSPVLSLSHPPLPGYEAEDHMEKLHANFLG